MLAYFMHRAGFEMACISADPYTSPSKYFSYRMGYKRRFSSALPHSRWSRSWNTHRGTLTMCDRGFHLLWTGHKLKQLCCFFMPASSTKVVQIPLKLVQNSTIGACIYQMPKNLFMTFSRRRYVRWSGHFGAVHSS